ncbi:Protein phosphatase 2C 1 [Mortierella sp. AD010]|nr:Protein phosphatase 2C 1 [Mortierella sp. AD010]
MAHSSSDADKIPSSLTTENAHPSQNEHQEQHEHHHQHHHHQHNHGTSTTHRQRPDSTSEANNPSLAISNSIEKGNSPGDTISVERSIPVTESEATPANIPTDDLQCVLKDLDEFEFAVGVSEDRNRRCRRTMEDTHAFIYNYEGITGHGFFAIFDGHAGKAAADWCGQHFHEVFGRILEEKADQPGVDFQELVSDTFLAVDQQLAEALQQGRSSGCTAIVAYIRKEGDKRVLYTGNVGDARAVLCHKEKAVRLSYDHKGSDHTEAQRILDVGGFVMNNRVNGVLSVTRALGDSSMKEFVIGAPYTTRTEIGSDNPYLILACDGLWDVCTDQEAVELIRDVVCPTKASRVLLDHALQKFSTDNISVMVVSSINELSTMLPPTVPTPATTSTSTLAPTPTSTSQVASPQAPIVEISDSLDPLSHLSHIFEKIRKQVIEWGEDANWKIDVFLLPNEDGTTASGAATSAPAPAAPSAPVRTLTRDATPPRSLPSRIEPPGSPRRYVIDLDSDIGTNSPRLALQPPPHDLPSSAGEGIPSSLKEQDVEKMSEPEAKQMLTLAIRQIRGQQESLSQAMLDLESMQRVSAEKARQEIMKYRRERDAEARLDVEKRIMERDAAILSRKWKDAEHILMEKEREIRDVQMQLEKGKQLIRERNEERRKRIAENGSLTRTTPGREGSSLAHTPTTPSRADLSPQFHEHRHRHVHNHRHHHRHLLKHSEMGNDSLENLAILATQVLMREPLIISKRVLNDNGSNENVAPGVDHVPRSDKKRTATEERDQGLQLRPVKRIDLTGIDSEETEVSPRQSSSLHNGPKAISNGRVNAEVVGKRHTPRSTQIQQSSVYQQTNSSSSTASKSGSITAKDSAPKPKA